MNASQRRAKRRNASRRARAIKRHVVHACLGMIGVVLFLACTSLAMVVATDAAIVMLN